MSLKVCADCGTSYLPADLCPHCGGGVYRFSWEEDVPKTTSGGTSAYNRAVPSLYPPEEPKPVKKPAVKAAKVTSAVADEEEAPDAEDR